MAIQLGSFGAWFNPPHNDWARTEFVVEAEAPRLSVPERR
jgi:hypothetical protein